METAKIILMMAAVFASAADFAAAAKTTQRMRIKN